MNAQEIIQYIATAEKKTPVKLYVKEKAPIDYGTAQVFGAGDKIVFGDWKDLKPILEATARTSRTSSSRTTAATPPFPCWT